MGGGRRGGLTPGGGLAGGWPLLVASCAAPALLEALLVHPLGLTATTLALQAGAPAPFGVFHDLRWLLVYASSWWQVGGWLVGMLIGRSLLTAAQLDLAWPTGEPRMSPRRLLTRSVLLTALSLVLLAPSAAIQYGMGIASLSFFFLGAIPAMLVLALLLHPALLRPWWRSRPSWGSAGWVLLTFGYLSVSGAVLVLLTPTERIPAVTVLAGVEALAWRRIVRALVRAPHPRAVPVAPVTVVVLAGLVLLTVTFSVGGNDPFTSGAKGSGSGGRAGDPPVLEISGFGDGWYGHQTLALPKPYRVVRFSYLGTTAAGAPRYYNARETYQPLPHLVDLLARQVAALHRATGHDVALVAESEGGLLAESYLLATPHPPVNALVVASPLVAPVSDYYPTHSAPGAGLAGSVLSNGVSHVLATLTPLALPPNPALFASAQSHGPAVREEQFCPVPGIRQLDVSPLADALSTPYHGLSGQRVDVIAAFHGGDLAESSVAPIVAGFIEHRAAPHNAGLSRLAAVMQALAVSWDAPPTAVSDVPAWRAEPAITGCAADRRELTGWLKLPANG